MELTLDLVASVAEALDDHEPLIIGDEADLARRLDLLRQISAIVREADAAIVADLSARMPHSRMTIPGVGLLERSPQRQGVVGEEKDRLSEALVASIASEVSTSQLTGERDPLAHRAAELAAAKMLACVQWSGAKAAAKSLARPINNADYRGGITGYRITIRPEEDEG